MQQLAHIADVSTAGYWQDKCKQGMRQKQRDRETNGQRDREAERHGGRERKIQRQRERQVDGLTSFCMLVMFLRARELFPHTFWVAKLCNRSQSSGVARRKVVSVAVACAIQVADVSTAKTILERASWCTCARRCSLEGCFHA